MTLSEPPPRFVRAGILASLALVAAIRFLTLAPDPWEWDEVLFVNAVERGIDVRINQPHPPGYPAFVESGRALRSVGLTSFDAATTAGTLGGFLSVLGVLFLGRKLGLSLPFALLASLLYAFVPAVWLHGVRPLSDPLATAAFLFAAGLLVEVVRSPRGTRLVVAAILTALTFGLRPQDGVALLPLALLAAVRVGRRPGGWPWLLAGVAAGLFVTVVIWRPAVEGSGGPGPFRERLAAQVDYGRQVDWIRAADLSRSLFWKRWFRDPFGDSGLAYTLYVIAGAAFVARRRAGLEVLGVFLPMTVLSMAFFPAHSAPRYALAVIPGSCLLASLAIERLAASWRFPAAVSGVGLLAWLAGVAVPPVLEVHRRSSPSVRAMRALRDEASLSDRPLFYDGHLEVHVARYLPGRRAILIPDDGLPALPPGALVVARDEDTFGLTRSIRTYRFEDPALGRISRGRYLEVRVYQARDAGSGAGFRPPPSSLPRSSPAP